MFSDRLLTLLATVTDTINHRALLELGNGPDSPYEGTLTTKTFRVNYRRSQSFRLFIFPRFEAQFGYFARSCTSRDPLE